MEKIFEFYSRYNEDTRITVRHPVEFIVTTHLLDSIIKNKDHILDVAAGTGFYSQYYALRGCKVESMDIVPEHMEALKQRITGTNLPINSLTGDACDLARFSSKHFDIVLNMGAIYHLDEQKILPCLNENLRVLKPGGYLVIAYVNKYRDFENDKYSHYFNFHSPAEMERYCSALNLEIISHKPTDGALYKDLEIKLNQKRPIANLNASIAFHEIITQIEYYHSLLGGMEDHRDISSIPESFIHALLITKNKLPGEESLLKSNFSNG